MTVELQDKRIFYVEDDLNNRTVVMLALRTTGAQIHFERFGHISNTLGAMRALGPWDLILLDLMFPNSVTGYDIMRAIRLEAEYESVPIVAISAADAEAEIPRARDAGFDGYISKPIDLRLFPKQLAEVINGQPLWLTQ